MAEAQALAQPWGLGRALKRLAIIGSCAALAACQTMVPRGRPPPPPTPTPTETPRPIAPGLPEDQARHRIALLVPLTGANANVGQSIANAATMAVLDTGGKRIRVTTYDTGTGAAGAAEKALADGNQVILGPLLAEDVRVVAPIASRAHVPVISFSNDTSVAGNGAFIMGFTPSQSIERVVRFARSKGLAKFAGLIPTGTYGQRASTTLLRSVESAGGQVVTLQNYDRSRASLSAAITKMAKDSPYDAVLIADSGRIAVQAAPMVKKNAGANARLLGTELWNADPAIASAPALDGAWFASVPDGLYRQLVAKYRARYGNAPYRIASMGYDAVLLVTRIAQDWPVDSAFPMRKLMDPEGFTGIDGAFRFDRDGIAERALEVQQIGGGKMTVVSPAPSSFRE